jgi:hypothetical protein
VRQPEKVWRALTEPKLLAAWLMVTDLRPLVGNRFPGFALLKEWAYAGMIFDLTGAAAAHAASGDHVGHSVATASPASSRTRPESD